MFSFLTRKKRIEAAPHIRRLIDATTPNRPSLESVESRSESRYCRAMPVLLTAMMDQEPNLDDSLAGITQEFSDSGLRLVTLECPTAEQYCATVWPSVPEFEAPLHIVCQTKSYQQLTANMWSTGLQIMWMLDIEDKAKLRVFDQFARTYFRSRA